MGLLRRLLPRSVTAMGLLPRLLPRYAQSSKEKRASFICRLVSTVVDNDPNKAMDSMEDFIQILHNDGEAKLLNHLFDLLYSQEKMTRQCVPTKLRKLNRILDVTQPLLREYSWVKGPPAVGDAYTSFNVIYHMKVTAQLNIDMSRVSEDNDLTIVAIATGCLFAASDKICWPRCVRAAGLSIAEQTQVRTANKASSTCSLPLHDYCSGAPRPVKFIEESKQG
ncbi:hypothetical protein NCS56_00143500 [Fusarium sp. Ph1]|nr:hypothetical protein NCS56_00143500 [Fusarium sp. Ph1]